MAKSKKIFYGIIIIAAIIILFFIFNKQSSNSESKYCETNSDCQNTCCGCTKKCDIECFVLPSRTCECVNNQCIEKKMNEIIIRTDKTEYKQGENVIASLDFNGFIWSEGIWQIQKFINNSWEPIFASGCLSHRDCENVNFEKIEECNFIMCERPIWMRFEKSNPLMKYYFNFSWDQKYVSEEKSYKCKSSGQIIDQPCGTYQTEVGKYKIVYKYAFDGVNVSERDENIKYAEAEFTIK